MRPQNGILTGGGRNDEENRPLIRSPSSENGMEVEPISDDHRPSSSTSIGYGTADGQFYYNFG